MTETTTAVEETADEIKPFVDEQDREIAYRSDSHRKSTRLNSSHLR